MRTSLLAVMVLLTAGAAACLGIQEMRTGLASSRFCGMCHAMRAVERTEWPRAGHARNPASMQVRCGECHVGTGLEGFLKDTLWRGGKDLAFTALGTPYGEADRREAKRGVRESLSISACRRCHHLGQGLERTRAARAAHVLIERDAKRCFDCHTRDLHPLHPGWVQTFPPPRLFSSQEMAARAAEGEGCIILDGAVFDVTTFRNYHSGGPGPFKPGQDNSRECIRCHPSPASTHMRSMLLGQMVDEAERKKVAVVLGPDLPAPAPATPSDASAGEGILAGRPRQSAPLILTLDLTLSRPATLYLYYNGLPHAPLVRKLAANSTSPEEFVFNLPEIGGLRLDLNEAPGARAEIRGLRVMRGGSVLRDLKPGDIAEWKREGARAVAGDNRTLTYEIEKESSVFLPGW